MKVGFYADQACTQPLTVSGDYVKEETTEDGKQTLVVLDSTLTADGVNNPELINAGGFSGQVTFDLAEYLKEQEGELVEVPEEGVTVYAKAWIEQDMS